MGTLRVVIFLGFLLFIIEGGSSEKMPHSFLDEMFKGEAKQKVEDLLAADLQYHQQFDAVDKVTQEIEETKNDIKFNTEHFKKVADTSVQTRKYYEKMEQKYNKYEALQKDQADWKRLEQSIPKTRWREMETGNDVLQMIQNAKERAGSLLKRLKPEHDVYESKMKDIKRKMETPEETREKVYTATLNDLTSQLQKLTDDKGSLKGGLTKDRARREDILLSAADSWMNIEKNDWDKFRGNLETGMHKFFNAFRLPPESSHKKENGVLIGSDLFPQPSIIRGILENRFTKRLQDLVFEYETRINGDQEERHQNQDLAEKQNDIERDKTLYNVENSILAGNRYVLTPLQRSELPLRRENALLDLIDEIAARAKVSRNNKQEKKMAKEIADILKLLGSVIASNNACNVKNKSFLLAENMYNQEIDRLLRAFESAARDLVMEPSVDEENARKKQEEVDKRLRLVQEMMDDLNAMANCVQTMIRMKATVKDLEAWRERL